MLHPSRARRAGVFTLLPAFAILLLTAGSSSAAVTVGDPLADTGTPLGCGPPGSANPCTVMISGLPGPGNVTVPADGVITRWRLRDSAGSTFKLRVLRQVSGDDFTFVSSSAPGTGIDPGIATFPTQQPVKAGDFIAVSWDGSEGLGAIGSVAGAAFEIFDSVPADGTDATGTPFNDPGGETEALFNADVEADADHDGFGDETQDQCPGVAGPNAGCPAPPAPAPAPSPSTPPAAKLRSSAHTAKLSHSGTVSFAVSSNENATGTATGTISVPRLAKVVRFAKHKVTLVAGKSTKVTLKLSKKNAKLVRKALAKHKKLKAKITLSVKNVAGKASTKKLTLKIH